jgi:tetratricopeptide (TPR) repeat protein
MSIAEKIGIIFVILTVAALQAFFFWEIKSYWLITLTVIPFLLITAVQLSASSSEVRKVLNIFRFMVLLTGPFASFGCLLITFLAPPKGITEKYREFLAAETVFSPSEQMELGYMQHVNQEEDTMIMPYIDIMEGSNSTLKRNTINKVIQHPGPNSRNILDIGLYDNDPEIRFYAASALILLNDSFIKEFREIGENIKKNPKNPHHHFELAASYDRYCAWNLAEAEDLNNYHSKIETSYEKALNLNPHNLNAMIGLSRIQIKQGKFTQALSVLQKGVKMFPNSRMLRLQYLKLLFRQGKFKELENSARQYLNKFPNISLEVQEAVTYWIEPKQPG